MSRRTREIGVRIALGAGRRSVLGLLAAAAGTRVMAGLLYAVSPLDPLTFGAVAVVLVGVAPLAAWVPARRAVGVDPVVALRGG